MPTPFINPYNFVEFDNNPDRITHQRKESVSGHNTYTPNGFSGRLTCRLATLSRLFVGSGSNRNQFNRINGLPAIQGSSLKGVIRSVAEAISSSCFTLMSEKYNYWVMPSKRRNYKSPNTGVRYQNIDNNLKFSHKNLLNSSLKQENCKILNEAGLCISCRLFGSSTDDENAQSFAGKVYISDANIGSYKVKNNLSNVSTQNINNATIKSALFYKQPNTSYLKKHMLSNPKPHHESFYTIGKSIRGRKFYYHQEGEGFLRHIYTEKEKDDIIVQCKNRNEHPPEFVLNKLEIINSNVIFRFTVDFQNLTEKELALLCLAIQLDGDCAHKIGQGKPIGLGSARITIEKIEEFNTANRYKKIQGANVIQDSQSINKINGWIDDFKKDNTVSFYNPGWDDLKAILHYPPYNHPIEYPSMKPWFQYNGSTPLPSPADVALGKNMLMK